MLDKRFTVPTGDQTLHEILAHLLKIFNTAIGDDVPLQLSLYPTAEHCFGMSRPRRNVSEQIRGLEMCSYSQSTFMYRDVQIKKRNRNL